MYNIIQKEVGVFFTSGFSIGNKIGNWECLLTSWGWKAYSKHLTHSTQLDEPIAIMHATKSGHSWIIETWIPKGWTMTSIKLWVIEMNLVI